MPHISHQVSREQIEQADIIFGIDDQDTENKTIFYGKSLLELIAGRYEGDRGVPLKILQVPLDWRSDEPEWLRPHARS